MEIKTGRNKITYILDKKFIFIKGRLQKDNSILFRCKQYRDKFRCPAFLIILDNELIKANPNHCHEPNLKDVNRYLMKDIIKNKINSAENCYNLKLKKTYDNIIIKNPEVDNVPKFDSIKSQLYVKLNNNLPKDIDDLLEIDKNSGYFKTLYGEKFLIYNDEDVIVLQSDIQARIMLENYEDIFLDGTFFSAPKCLYQILIIRVNFKHSYKYATTGFALCKNKTEKLYRLILYEINKNLNAIGGKIFRPNNKKIFYFLEET